MVEHSGSQLDTQASKGSTVGEAVGDVVGAGEIVGDVVGAGVVVNVKNKAAAQTPPFPEAETVTVYVPP